MSISLTSTAATNDYQPILSTRQACGGRSENGRLFQTRYFCPSILIFHKGKQTGKEGDIVRQKDTG